MDLLNYVNILQGTASVRRFSCGNTLPLVQRPFGMCAFSAQTSSENSWFFHPDARSLEGIRLTHQPSPWIEDYGTLVFMPQKGSFFRDADSRWSGYKPEKSVFTPYYMKLDFLRSRCCFELTPTERGGSIRIKFDDEKDNLLSFHSLSGFSSFQFESEKSRLYCIVTDKNDENAKNFRMYTVIEFPAFSVSPYDSEKAEGDCEAFCLRISNREAEIKFAASYISFEQAEINLKRELKGRAFDEIKEESRKIWEEYISLVRIETEDENLQRTFCSCMYRAFLFPHKAYEINENNEKIHYSPSTGKTEKGVRYTDNGFWDTYRTSFPFYSIVLPELYSDMCEGFANEYLESGWLPRWLSIGERGCMPSTLIDAVIADGAVKNLIDRKTLEILFEGMLKHAENECENEDYGRNGCKEYCRLGYVPIEAHRESVNLTLDAAYGDYCISVTADILGKKDIGEKYRKRSYNYKNLFDKETLFMRAKYKNGLFRENFNPFEWGRDYTEGSAWQNSFAVPHDMKGLAELYGGKDNLLKKIDELFSSPAIYETGGYNSEIHEMTEMAACDFGQCAISNQPSFHIPYIYSEMGEKEKSIKIVKKLCREAFSYKNDGFPGDEDNGSMACWFIFSVMGIYPFCPGRGDYVKTEKLADKVFIKNREFDPSDFEEDRIKHKTLGIF